MIFLKILFFVVLWAATWGGCICELYSLDENDLEINDYMIIVALVLAPAFFVAFGIFCLYYKTRKGAQK